MTYNVKGKTLLVSEVQGSRTGENYIYRSPGITKWNSLRQVV